MEASFSFKQKVPPTLVVTTCTHSIVDATHLTFLTSHLNSYTPWVHCSSVYGTWRTSCANEWQGMADILLCVYPRSMHILHCPNGLHCRETSPAPTQCLCIAWYTWFICQVTDWSLLPTWWAEHAAWRWPSSRWPQGRVTYPLSQLHCRAGDCVATDRRVSLQLVWGYLQYSSMCEDHEHQDGCAGFPMGGCAEVVTLFGSF